MTSAVACFQLQFSDMHRPSLEPRSTDAISTNRAAPQKMSAEKLHRALVSEPIIIRAQLRKQFNFWEVVIFYWV